MKEDQSQPIVGQVSNIVVCVDGYWLRHYAGDFLAAAETFSPPESRFSPVQSYLFCHSIELSLKSFLFSRGMDKAKRKLLNHNLEKALRSAEDNGLNAHLQVSAEDRELLQKATRLYCRKEFEYFESLETIYDSPDFELNALASFALKLFKAIEVPVNASVVR